VKQSIKRSLLSLMLLGAAANIQASTEEEQGGGGAAAVADQETPSVEQMKKLVLGKVKTAIKEILINWPATVDKAVEMVGDTDGSIRTAMNMMFESFPEDVELTADVLEILIDAPLNKLMDDYSETKITRLLVNLDRIITNVIANYTENHRIKLYTVPIRDILLEKIVKNICKTRMYFYHQKVISAKMKNYSIRSIIPTDEKLAAIITQSQTRHKITFLKGEDLACWRNDRGAFIITPENYRGAGILHEIGHIENETSRTLNDLRAKLFKIIKQIIDSELSIENKLNQLLTTNLIMLSVYKKEERDADSFELQKATKKQLTEDINCFLNGIPSFDDYLEINRKNLNARLRNEQIVQMICNFYHKIFDIFGIKYDPKILTQDTFDNFEVFDLFGTKYDPKKRSTQQLLDILGIKNVLAYVEFFYAVHPSIYSRMARIQERIAELDAENPLEPCLAQLKAEAETITAVERKFDFAQKSTLEKLFAKITHCRYLQFLAGTKKAPREQLRARL
jgi:hypothetical protein